MLPISPKPSLAESSAAPNKRRKTQLACHPCRARKTGCDGQRPCCSLCVAKGGRDRCTYPEPVSRFSPSAPTLADLDRRVRNLEERPQVQLPSFSTVSQANDLIHSETSSKINHRHQDANLNRASPSVDSNHIYGGSSNAAFIQDVASVVGTDFEHVDSTAISAQDPSRWSSHAEYNVNDLVLPPRQTADSQLNCYRELFHPISPILHWPTFHAKYSQLWEPHRNHSTSSHRDHDILFHATMNIVLALGSQRNEDLAMTEREDLAGEFYKRSVKQVSIDAIDTSSLEIVQLLLLRGFYLLYTPQANRCWNTVGAALRVAQAIGLQSAQAKSVTTQLSREMRRRVWHNCVSLDWMTSLSFDRPSSFPDGTNIALPELIDDIYLSESGEVKQPSGIPSGLEFFVYAMKLVIIRRKGHSAQSKKRKYSENTSSGKGLGATLDSLKELDQFLEDLPPHLQSDGRYTTLQEPGIQACFKLQGSVLKARVMYGRLGILRPLIIAEAIRNMQHNLMKELCDYCISTAHQALNDLHHQLSSVYRSSPWHTLYFTFAAASVIIAGTLCPHLNVRFDQDPCKISWNKALSIFTFHKAHVASAEKGIKALERFKDYVEARQSTAKVVGACVDNKIENVAVDDLGISKVFTDLDPAAQNIFEADVPFDMPLDESWFLSQDFHFDDDIMNWK